MRRKETMVARQIGHVAVTRSTRSELKTLLSDTTSYRLLPGSDVVLSDVMSEGHMS
jgi:hypothetical protein